MDLQQIQQAIDNGAVLVDRWNTERRMEFIEAIPHGYAWFYNGDRQGMSSDFARFIEENRVNLNAWMLLQQPASIDPRYKQLELFH